MSEETLEQKVYRVVANHPRSSLYGIAHLLDEPLKDVKVAVRGLKDKGLILSLIHI